MKPHAYQKEMVRRIANFIQHPYAWPGGYPCYGVSSDGEVLCHACVKANYKQIAHAVLHHLYDGWRIDAIDVNWEDPTLYCAECNKPIESAYAG